MAPCKLCNDLCKRDESHRELSFDFTLEEISKTISKQGCHSCTVIYEGLCQAEGKKWPSLEPRIKRVYARCHGKQGNHEDTLHLVVRFKDDAPSLNLEFYSLESEAWGAILPRQKISKNPLSRDAVMWAQDHIEFCDHNHKSCRYKRPQQLPKRLLSLGKPSFGNLKVKLIEVNSSFSDEYAALSHCWGEKNLLNLTKRNLKSYKEAINWASIPRTFQDAITLALNLKISYLWIDSLCILQDNPKDWEVESAKMASIYQHAVLTLAATTASSGNEGTYSRENHISKHLEIILPINMLRKCRIGVRKRVQHWNKTTHNNAQNFPLLTRGWVLQERLLSRRILHVCDTELIWECREATDCECGILNGESSPGGIFYRLTKTFDEQRPQLRFSAAIERFPAMFDRSMTTHPISKLRESWSMSPPSTFTTISTSSRFISSRPSSIRSKRRSRLSQDGTQTESIPEFVPHFHRLVEQYSALKLTRLTDRLPAFSGLAERMQYFRGDYLAGLWADSLCFDLMWRIDKYDLWAKNSSRPWVYRGPSWSWASAIAPVKYWTDTNNYTDTVQRFVRELEHGGGKTTTPLLLNKAKMNYDIRVTNTNPFGSVEFGMLTLEASAMTATLHYRHQYVRNEEQTFDWRNPAHDRGANQVTYYAEVEYGDEEDKNFMVEVFADYIFSLKGPAEVAAKSELTLLLVHPDVALVLRRKVKATKYVTVGGHAAWERIGIARLTTEIPGYGCVDWMMHSEIKTFRIM